MSESLYHILKPQGIRTLVTGPIEVNGKYIGFYGVDNPPVELMDNISTMINMMEFVISMMIRIRNYAREVEENALRDQLTGCRSRKALSFAYDGDFAKNQSIALIMCDLNGLKKKNDTKGHEAGDKYLCDAAEVLFACFGNENVYRVGGDEFVIVLFDVDLNAVNEKIDKMLVYLELKEVSMAYGFAYRKNAKEPFENLLREADKRMYEDKRRYYDKISGGKH